ncbi:MAG: DNA mismatch repair endonuclease MutL [Anaerolineae bacterium]
MTIKALPPEVTAQIAAGEVVERPASVVKELLENALDAGATSVQVEVRDGGQRLIQVADDGCGIAAEEVVLAFGRHTTSKLERGEDLYNIRTLGFRGEALASIAAVARVTMTTRAREAAAGRMVRFEGGELILQQPCARPAGTTVQVENLFYNLPARRKFLKAESTEQGHILNLLIAYALAYPGVRFGLVMNGREALRTTGQGRWEEALAEALGVDTARAAAPLPTTLGRTSGNGQAVRVSGFVGAPSLHRGSRDCLFLFVNGRWVQDRSLAYAVEEAYRSLLPVGRHPVALVDVRVDPAEVDVNIHPTKREVRFRQGQDLFGLVQRTVRRSLVEQAPLPQVASLRGEAVAPEGVAPALHVGREAQPALSQLGLELMRPVETAAGRAGRRLPPLRIIGQVAQTYILAEGPEGLYIIDQHAAHERVLYERLQGVRAGARAPAQALLEPRAVELTRYQARILEERLETVRALGFDISHFGGLTYLVRAVPASFPPEEIINLLAELLRPAGERDVGRDWEERALVTVVCHGAVRAGQALSETEMRDLVRQLEQTMLPYTCPHGRPTIVEMTEAQLEREFKRR